MPSLSYEEDIAVYIVEKDSNQLGFLGETEKSQRLENPLIAQKCWISLHENHGCWETSSSNDDD